MKRYLVEPGQKVNLKSWEPDETKEFDGDKEEAQQVIYRLNLELNNLQEMLYAEHKHRLLVILQGMDTSGKDGVIQSVFEGVNPQGVKVAGFKTPTPIELDHDYLWRVHSQVPGKGEIVIFNRSHYEDVLVVRVHNLVPEEVWKRRYDHIKAFEQMMADEGVTILKFFLHISPDEQKERFLDRLAEQSKRWKFNPNDLEERKLWPAYTEAYEDALSRTSEKHAPWYVVPSDKKWYRNLVISSILVNTLKNMNMKYPAAIKEEDVEKYRQMLA
jgi:PPK2 family polyphosphate:nucleotide phosphotransferase